MDELLTLNFFALSLPLAWLSAGLFAGLILLPLYFNCPARPVPEASGNRPPH